MSCFARRASGSGHWARGVVPGAALLASACSGLGAQAPLTTARIAWQDVAVFHDALQARAIDRGGFDAHVERLRRTNLDRVREGDLDHLVFYLLQSPRFTTQPRIEPAESAKALVDSLSAEAREAFLGGGPLAATHVPPPVRARAAALLRALDDAGAGDDARLEYFRDLVGDVLPSGERRETALLEEYIRTMRFLYQQEFVSRHSRDPAAAVRELYQRRGLSTDTAVEAGFVVHTGLGVVKGLDPDRRIRRVLIVGPGMDLAPRTAFVEGPAVSYQPWAVIDALLSLGLATERSLEVVAADINPRVVAHLRRARSAPPTLWLWPAAGEEIELTEDYRDYFEHLGHAIRVPTNAPGGAVTQGSKTRRIAVRPDVGSLLRSVALDIVTERLEEQPFDLVIATNVLPYFDDTSLMLAMTNIAHMLAPGGTFLHNEPRPALGDVTEALGLSFEQSRHAVIARVRGAAAPLGDSVFLHRKRDR